MTLRTALPLTLLLAFPAAGASAADPGAILTNYSDIAHAGYEDSLTLAKSLREAVQDLVDAPSDATLNAAKQAWLAARVPYQQTEAFRFGNPTVDEWKARSTPGRWTRV